jgi:hypothetical protein
MSADANIKVITEVYQGTEDTAQTETVLRA